MLRSIARLTGAAVGGTSAVLFSQMWYVRLKFQLPPDAAGPLNGVAKHKPESHDDGGTVRSLAPMELG